MDEIALLVLRHHHRNQQEEDPQNPSLRRTVSPATDLRFKWFQAPTTPPVCERQDHSLGLEAGTVFEAPEDHHCQVPAVLEEVFFKFPSLYSPSSIRY